jgi:hypothetical protein
VEAKSQRSESNRRPAHYECAALPAELRWQKTSAIKKVLSQQVNQKIGCDKNMKMNAGGVAAARAIFNRI